CRNAVLELSPTNALCHARAGPTLVATVDVEVVVAIDLVEDSVCLFAGHLHFGSEIREAPAAYDDFLRRFKRGRVVGSLGGRRLALRSDDTSARYRNGKHH